MFWREAKGAVRRYLGDKGVQALYRDCGYREIKGKVEYRF